jgi:hypothetical protein
VVDTDTQSSPTLSYLQTFDLKVNCLLWRAETSATISGPGVTTFLCGKGKNIVPDSSRERPE